MEKQTQLVIFIIITFIAILSPAMVVVAIISGYRRKISEKETRILQIEHHKKINDYKIVVEAEENERQKIAKNLHDGIISKLSVIKSSLDMNVEDHSTENYDLTRLKKDIYNLELIIGEIRDVSHDLLPPSLVMNGAILALDNYIKYAHDSGNATVDFDNRTSFENDLPFTMPEQHNIFRICLELLHNLQKHANYKVLHVIADTTSDGKLKIEFIHDGTGIDNIEIERLTKSSHGLGLKSLISRASILGAKIDYSFDKETAGVILEIPFKIIKE